MKKIVKLIMLMSIFIIAFSISTYADDRTSDVTAAASKVEAAPTSLGIYPYIEIDTENPWDKLCRVTITFRDINNKLIYQHYGDTVNFFIKSSRDAEMGWVDKNANDDFEDGEELDATAMGTSNGFYVTGAKLTRSSTVVFYVGSRTAGSFAITVYTDKNGKPGTVIGQASPKVEAIDSKILLTAYNEEGSTLSEHSGHGRDPFELVAGDLIELRASVKIGSTPLKDQTVTFKKSTGLSSYEVIGTDITDEDGIAVLEYEGEEAELYTYQAVVDENESEEIYINYSAADPEKVEAKTSDGKLLVYKEEYEIEFYVKDDYGNPIDSKGINNVEFTIVDTPRESILEDYSSSGMSDKNGIASFKFKPDKLGTYGIRCKLTGGRDSDTIDVESVFFDEVKSMRFNLKNGDTAIPAAMYKDSNDNAILESSGYLEVTLVDEVGTEMIAKRYSQNNLVFTSSNNDIVEVDYDGDIIVKDKEFSGSVPITVMDNTSKTTGVYNLNIAGPPVAIKPVFENIDRKGKVTLQYVDKKGNATYYKDREEYEIELPATGFASWDVEDFDSMGKASFMLNSDEYSLCNIKVTSKLSNISKKFQVEFKPTPKTTENTPIGAKNVIMFIGVKSYSQDGTTKSTDVAPFIKDGRTFVAVRPVADAFGASIEWNETTRTVTLSRSDMIVTIVIGSNTITIVKDGISSAVIADVPAMITEGRTVLPFRAVGNAFGAAVSYDDATKSVCYTQ